MAYCTLAQFYPFEGDRGVALRFSSKRGETDYPLHFFECYNTLVTGYADDEVMGEAGDSLVTFSYYFANCILRTPAITESAQLVNFSIVLFEQAHDSVQGADHFYNIDADNQYYDFHLDSVSTAIGRAVVIEGCGIDRDGAVRGGRREGVDARGVTVEIAERYDAFVAFGDVVERFAELAA